MPVCTSARFSIIDRRSLRVFDWKVVSYRSAVLQQPLAGNTTPPFGFPQSKIQMGVPNSVPCQEDFRIKGKQPLGIVSTLPRVEIHTRTDPLMGRMIFTFYSPPNNSFRADTYSVVEGSPERARSLREAEGVGVEGGGRISNPRSSVTLYCSYASAARSHVLGSGTLRACILGLEIC